MKKIYILCVKEIGKSFMPFKHTVYFENPPNNADLVETLNEFLNPKKYHLGESLTKLITSWVTFFEKQKFEYYAQDLKSVPTVWSWNEKIQLELSAENIHWGGKVYAETPVVTPEAVKSPKTGK